MALRAEFDRLSPKRDRGADGSIGDSAHTSSSDHTPDEDSDVLRDHDADAKNEVHALDIDSTGPWPEPFSAIISRVIERERARWLDPDDVCRLEYVIFNRRIYSRSRDFAARTYTGSDPHTNHAHFSGRYLAAAESDTSPWGVEAEMTKDEIKAAVREVLRESGTGDLIGDAVLQRKFPAPAGVADPDGVWWYGSFDREAYDRLLELKTAVDTLLERVPKPLGGSEFTGR